MQVLFYDSDWLLQGLIMVREEKKKDGQNLPVDINLLYNSLSLGLWVL